MRVAVGLVILAGWLAAPGGGSSPLDARATASAQRPVAEIPFKWPGLGQIELAVSVERQPAVAFLLDTGAEYSVVSTDITQRLGLQTSRTGARDFADGVSLEFGAVRLERQRVMIMPFDNFRQQKRPIEGLIGYDFFQRFVVQIDYENGRLSAWEPSSFEHAPGAARVPLEFVRRLSIVPLTITVQDRGAIDARLVLDTGASQTVILRHPFASRHKLLELVPDAPTLTSPSLAMGPMRLVRIPAPSVRLADWTLSEPFIRAHLDPAGLGGYSESDGVVGNEVLRRFRVTVDYSRRLMTLEPNARLREAFAR